MMVDTAEMYLIDTDVISELRKKDRANNNVLNFIQRFRIGSDRCLISVITLGVLRRGVELIRHRGDAQQAKTFEQ